jgi:hypothetical protein
MLAPFIKPPLPSHFSELAGRIELSGTESEKYLGYGWSGPEPGFRWTDGTQATIVFAASSKSDIVMRVSLAPFLLRGRHDVERVDFVLNGHFVRHLELRDDGPVEIEITLPGSFLREQNVLLLNLPDAASPSDFDMNVDHRQLGVAVRWIDFSIPAQP